MVSKPLHPMHDDTGRLWPELDWRWVTATTIKKYDNCSNWLVYMRTLQHWYGPIGSTLVRRKLIPGGKVCRIHEYCPAAIWRAKRFGRYADPSFDPRAITTRPHECDPVKTADRQRVRPAGEYSPEIQQLLAQQSGALMQALAIIKTLSPNCISSVSEPIAFTR